MFSINDHEINLEIARRVQQAMERGGMRKSTLALEALIDPKTLTAILSGHGCRMETLRLIAAALGCSVGSLLADSVLTPDQENLLRCLRPIGSDTPSQQSIGANIRRCRCAAKMTQAALGQAVGLSRQAIVDVERGKHDPRACTLIKIAGALMVPVESLLPLTAGPDGNFAAAYAYALQLLT